MRSIYAKPRAHPRPLLRRRRHRQGFTLVEMMVAVTLMGFVMTGVAVFFRQTSLIMFVSEEKLKINRDIRSVTNEMTDNARDANHFTLYESFYANFRTPGAGEEHEDYRLRDGQTGDCLVLIFYGDDPTPFDTTPPPIVRLVGYFRTVEETATNEGPVRKFDVTISGANQYKKVEELVPGTATVDAQSVVVEASKGLADGKLFYNFRDRSIMVNGQIRHGNNAKRVTDTYNFTISPRG